jgi:hypothetical protein
MELGGDKVIPKPLPPKRVSKDQVRISLILSDETQEELEKLKGLLGKELSMDELIKFMAKAAIKQVEKEKFKQTDRPRKTPPAAVAARTPTAAVKSEVYKRDRCCTNCESTHRLNYDHIRPYSHGGSSEASNIRILCRSCNERARIRMKL